MTSQTITITKEEYKTLKKKAEIADDLLVQLDNSLKDALAGRIKRIA